MRVISASSALLSDYEVLALLRELEQHWADKYRKRKGKPAGYKLTIRDEAQMLETIPVNIREAQLEAVNVLSEGHRGCAHQKGPEITAFLDALRDAGFAGPHGPDGNRRAILTKAEQLQIVNHVPQSPVELYTLVDDMESRLSDHMYQLLELVQTHLPAPYSVNKAMEEAEEKARKERAEEEAEEAREAAARKAAKAKKNGVVPAEDDMDEDMNEALASSMSTAPGGDDLIHEERGEAVDDEEKPQE